MTEPRKYFEEHATDEPWHVERYVKSWEWIEGLPKEARILDCGGSSPFRGYLTERGYTVESTGDHDLRYPLEAHKDDAYDFALCMEVIEHLKDKEETSRCTYTGSGVRGCLYELFRTLKPGGRLLLTTPNVCSAANIWRMIQGQHPFAYQLHFRELCADDVIGMLQSTGFMVDRFSYEQVWRHHVPPELTKALASLNLIAPHLRSDCLFFMARKPDA